MNERRKKLLQYLVDHPTWHFGLDLVKAGVGTRAMIYIDLSELEFDGFVERRLDPGPLPAARGGMQRHQFRATGKRLPDEEFDGKPSFA